MGQVENQAYKPPEGYSTLAYGGHMSVVTKLGDFSELPQLALDLGFHKRTDFSTKKAAWHVYNRPNHEVPNFSHDSTRISSTLAVYEEDDGLTHALLRTSKE